MIKKQAPETVVSSFLHRWGVAKNDRLVVGVSGGVDSMTLATILVRLGFLVTMVHINHGLRKTAKRDELAVSRYADKLGIPCVIKTVSLGNAKTSIEERARDLRYRALREVAKALGAKYIVTAHTADDQVETILFNFLRGAGLRGLAGMKERSEDGLLRPLLSVRKSELVAYARAHRIKFVNDETNKSKEFTRNRIRLELLPRLRTYNQTVDGQVLATGRLLAEAEQAMAEWVSVVFGRIARLESGKVVIRASGFRELTGFMRAEILKRAVVMLGGDLTGLSQAHYDEAVRFVTNLTGRSASKKIGGKLWLTRGYDKITVSQK